MAKAFGALVGAVVLSAVLAACGGGGSTGGSTTAATQLNKTQVVKAGNNICAKAERARLTAFKQAMYSLPSNGTLSIHEQEQLLPKALTPYLQAAQKLDGLNTSDAQAAKISAVTAAMRAAYRKAQRNPNQAVTADSTIFGDANELALKSGLSKCVL